MKTKKPIIVYYDIETSYLLARIWRPGKQFVSHKQLVKGSNMYGIICLSYAINDGPVKTIDWGYDKQDTSRIVKEFDKIIAKADVVIGKNNVRFDDKHLNTHRMLNDMDGMPEFGLKVDDLEQQMRRHFYLPSFSLDYFSDILGLGGKVKMDMEDWVDIVEKHPTKGKKSLKKMIFYNQKDVRDTRAIWKYCLKHFKPKFNMSVYNNKICCKQPECGSSNLRKDGVRQNGKTKYQMFYCREHHGYAGRVALRKDGTYNPDQTLG